MKRKGHRTEPWGTGTPEVTGEHRSEGFELNKLGKIRTEAV